ncbi:hypothetical protein [Roseivirga misakiensis]|nr:hypothetical protein [Roseivirga misakiensis]
MNSKLKITLIAVFTLVGSMSAVAQDEALIYGKLTTIDGDTYTGQIRWGDEEAMWVDIFNGNKEDNENYRYLSREDRRELRNRERRSWNGFNISWNSNSNYETTHEFQAQFGNISKIEINRRSEVKMTMRDGETVYVKDGSNDFNTTVHIMDKELGKSSFRWSRIETIEFMDTPSKLDETMGAPLYGTVEIYGGEYTGFIEWDHDERISTDILDGDTRDGDVKIEFGKLKSIERERSGSNVITKSGRELYLRGSNDVNGENRGIIVSTDFGQVDIPWRDFKKVTFKDAPKTVQNYKSFANLKRLSGTVTTVDGETLSGDITYDLDEAYSYEMLQGKDDDVEFIITMGSIKSITPKNYDYSSVVLKNGTELLIGDARDVNEDNDGVLVFSGSGDPKYIAWEDVKSITFN